MATFDLTNVPSTQFFAKAVEANPDLDSVIKAVSSGVLQITAWGGKVYFTLDQIYGTGDIPPYIVGAATIYGPPIPTMILPPNGMWTAVFTFTFNVTRVSLTLKDMRGMILWIYEGEGFGTNLPGIGTISGTWIKRA